MYAFLLYSIFVGVYPATVVRGCRYPKWAAVNVFVIYISALFPICRKSVANPLVGEKQCNSIIGNLNKRMYANMIIIITDKESERARGLPEVANCELCLTLETIRFSMGVRDMNIIRNILFTQAWNLCGRVSTKQLPTLRGFTFASRCGSSLYKALIWQRAPTQCCG